MSGAGWNLQGLDQVRVRLAAAMAAGRLHHALLLTGPRGAGKRSVARAIARGLLCTCRPGGPDQQQPGGCGTCGACQRVDGGQHSDLGIAALPPGKTRIPVEDVRALIDELQRCPLEGRARVALVLDAEALGIEGQNSLLKTLEEPAPSTWLVLTAARPEALLGTVRSRVERIGVPCLGAAELAALLVARHGVDRQAASRIALLSGGSTGLALELAAGGGAGARDLEQRCAALQQPGDAVAAILGDVESDEGLRQAKIDRARQVLAACLRQLHERGRQGDTAALAHEESVLSALADLDLGLGAEVVLTWVHRSLTKGALARADGPGRESLLGSQEADRTGR